MKREALFHEIAADVRCGTARAGIFGLLFALLVALAAAADLAQIRQLTASADAWRSSGASITVASAEGRIDGQACSRLASVEGVRAAGALRTKDGSELQLAQLPAAPVQIAEVTPGFERLLGTDTGGARGIVLAREAAEPLGLSGPATVALRDGSEADVSAIYDYPSDGRVPGYGYLALAPVASSESFDECWIDVFPQSDVRTSLLYSTLRPGTGSEEEKASIFQLNSRLGQSFDGLAMMATRLTRFAPVAAFAAAVGLGFAGAWRRRLEFASKLHAGMSRRSGRAILFLETAAWAGGGAAAALAAVAMLIASDPGADRVPLFLIAGRVFVAAGFGVAAGTGFAWWRTREEQLFRYFKER